MVEGCRIGYQPVFQHFGIACFELARVEGLKKNRVDVNAGGLLKNAELILETTKINPRFTPDTGIYLSQQSRRNLNKIYSALVQGSGKTAQISDHTAT